MVAVAQGTGSPVMALGHRSRGHNKRRGDRETVSRAGDALAGGRPVVTSVSSSLRWREHLVGQKRPAIPAAQSHGTPAWRVPTGRRLRPERRVLPRSCEASSGSGGGARPVEELKLALSAASLLCALNHRKGMVPRRRSRPASCRRSGATRRQPDSGSAAPARTVRAGAVY